MRVDRALNLAHVSERQIEDAQSVAPGTDYISGVAKLADGQVLIRDLRTFLEKAEAAALDFALSHVEASTGGAA